MKASFRLTTAALRGLWAVSRGHRRTLLTIGVLAMATAMVEAVTIASVLAVAGAVATGEPVRLDLLGRQVTLEIGLMCAVSVGAISSRLLLQLGENWFGERLTENVRHELRVALITAFINAPPLDGAGHEELQTLATSYLEKGRAVIRLLPMALSSAVAAVVLMLGALAVDPVATGIFLLMVILVTYPSLALTRIASAHSARARDSLMTFSHELSELALFRREAQSFGVTAPMRNALDQPLEDLRHSFFWSALYVRIVPLLFLNVSLCLLVAVLYSAHLVGTASAATIVAVALLIRGLQAAQRAQTGLTGMVAIYPFVEAVVDRTRGYLGSRLADGQRQLESLGAIELRDVRFRYAPDQPTVLDSVDLRVAPGEIVGLVGPSGAGKSTIIGLLLRHFDPDAGQISVDGTPIAEIARLAYARRIGYVPQQCRLLSGPIAENIRFFREIDDARVEQAARRAGVHDELMQLPQGYQTPAGDLGDRLSGGQRQRIVLARMRAADPDLLLLDEPTSALDADSEAIVRRALLELRDQGKSVFVVAHRATTMEVCDRVIELRDGRVTELDRAASA